MVVTARNEEDLHRYLQTVEDIEEKETEWVIPSWIAKGGITLLVGDGGVGKTNLWCYLISRISGGLPTMLDDPDVERETPPGLVAAIDYQNKTITEKGPNRTCLFFSKEDSTAKRLKEALEMYDADASEIHTVDIEHLNGFNYASQNLEAFIEELRPAICVFDPLQAFYPHGASMSSRQQSREALDHLIRLGQMYNTAFLLVCHTNKRKTDDWRERISGTADLADIARSVIFTSYTELEPQHRVRYISNEKNSYAPLQETVLYTVGKGGRIEYKGFSGKRFADYVYDMPYQKAASKPKSQTDLCKETITALLQETGQMALKELDETLAEAGFTPKVMRTAKAEMENDGKIIRERTTAEDPVTGKKSAKWLVRQVTEAQE